MKHRNICSILAACALLLGSAAQMRVPCRADAPITAEAADYGSEVLADAAYQVAAIVNRERAAHGLQPLKYSDALSSAAIVRAQEIQQFFSHTRPNGASCFTALTEQGITYRYAGENIAYGQRSPEEVMTAWMNSEGHRANILSTNVEYIGIGVTQRGGVYYWTQFFAASDMLTGTVITEGMPVQTTDVTTVTFPAQTTASTADTTAVVPAESDSDGCNAGSIAKLEAWLERLSNMLGIDLRAMLGK